MNQLIPILISLAIIGVIALIWMKLWPKAENWLNDIAARNVIRRANADPIPAPPMSPSPQTRPAYVPEPTGPALTARLNEILNWISPQQKSAAN